MALNKIKILKVADKYIAKQHYNKALNELLKVVKESPSDINLLNKVGDLYSQVGNKSSAITYFIKVAESYQKSGFNLKAIALYKKIIRLDLSYMDARERLVNLYLQQGHHSEAKAELRRMADYFHSQNTLSRALACYEKMVDIDPSNLDARIKITEILVREGKREKATRHFVAMARELLEKRLINEARKIIGQGLKVAPTNGDLIVLQTKAQIAEGKVNEAVSSLREIIKADPDNLNALRLLGRTYLDRGNIDEACELCTQALKLSEEEAPALEEVARKYTENKELDKACRALGPVSQIYLNRDKHDEATRLYRSILYVDENHIPSQERLVEIYTQAKQNANAILTLEKIINFYQSRGRQDKVKEKIETLLALDPENLEWKSKLEAMGGSLLETPPEYDNAEIHVFDDQAMDLPPADHAELMPAVASLAPQGNINLEPDDTVSQIANHLTEAEVFMKYGILDQALTHLLAVKDLDLLNMDANSKLKQIYVEKNEIDNAVGCLVCMVNSCIDREEFHRAGDFVKEIREFRPDIAKIHSERLETYIQEETSREQEEHSSFALDFEPARGVGGDVIFSDNPGEEVVDFRELNSPSPDGAPVLPGLEGAPEGGAWSLDMPQPEEDDGLAEDLRDLYQFEEETSSKLEPVVPFGTSHAKDTAAPDSLLQPKAETPAQKAIDKVSLASELEEIDFFISVEAFEDAKNLLNEAHQRFGDHPMIQERFAEIAEQTKDSFQKPVTGPEAPSPRPEPAAAPEPEPAAQSLLGIDSNTGFFDLAAELSEELFDDDIGEINDNTSKEEIQSVDELFEEFKKGVEEQIDESDHETHYDLGIAYKEMGLLEEAISEFQKAWKDPNRLLECTTMIGKCLIELGRNEEAVKHYRSILQGSQVSNDQYLAILYEIALAYEGMGDLEQALGTFLQIKERDPDYRDLETRIAALV